MSSLLVQKCVHVPAEKKLYLSLFLPHAQRHIRLELYVKLQKKAFLTLNPLFMSKCSLLSGKITLYPCG